jgi:hypothetical protein
VSGYPLRQNAIHLYNIATDPTEQVDVAAQHPALAAAMVQQLLSVEATGTHTAVNDPACGPAVLPVDPHVGKYWAPWC